MMAQSSAIRTIRPARNPVTARAAYLARIARVYAAPGSGPLSFWYEVPLANPPAIVDGRQYYMRFQAKAAYLGPFDRAGIPLLDYRGDIGRQYNPIAIAQFGLGRFNRWCASGSVADRAAWLAVSRWLAAELRPNAAGIPVWSHGFDWPYRAGLAAPWHSGLAQGAGLSMLVRAARETDDPVFVNAAHEAWRSFQTPVHEGGVVFVDRAGHTWIEEYIVDPPSHILNGFIWAMWGVLDYARWSAFDDAQQLWKDCVRTLEERLWDYDTDWWSLYELPGGSTRMLASRYYHSLHITQLRVLHAMTGSPVFQAFADRFDGYREDPAKRLRATAGKAWFKVRHY